MMAIPVLDTASVLGFAHQSAAVSKRCDCARKPIPGWESQSSTFPEELLEYRGKISAEGDGELTVEEFHPERTNLWSPEAPIALRYFPANRSEVWQCTGCSRCYLRYTEYGGYYVDRRIRALRPELIVDMT